MMAYKRNVKYILYLFTIVFFALFYYFLPFAGDDWAWGSDIGIERLKNGFDGYNGRYLGNILIIIVTRSVIARIIICTFIMFLLILILSKIFDNLSDTKNSNSNYIIAFSSVLILVLPNQIAFGDLQPFQIFGSTVGWLSGFTNYVVPSALILFYYYFATNKKAESKFIYLLLVFDGVLSCLCVEHYTLFCLMFSFSVIVYRFYYDRKICKKSLSFFVGAFVGALIMFTNSSYLSMQKGNINDKQRAVGLIGSFKKYGFYVFGENADKALVYAFDIFLFISIASFLVFFFIKMYKSIKSRNVSKLLPMICLVFMTLPLLFTNSGKEIYVVAPRCYFLQYFMIVIYLYNKFKDKLFTKKFAIGLKTSFVVLVIITSIIYCRLDYMGMVRDNMVNEALEQDSSTVEIIQYPKSVEHIQWSSNFIEKETYIKRYQNFKKIPDNKSVIVTTNN